jgi:hypothetical protein
MGQLDDPLIHLKEEQHELSSYLFRFLQLTSKYVIDLQAIEFFEPRKISKDQRFVVRVSIYIVAFDSKAFQDVWIFQTGQLLNILQSIV